MWLIYHLEVPFFERYKINSEPWPWKKDKKLWKEFLCKSILLVSFNMLVTFPLASLGDLYFSDWKIKFTISAETLPNTSTLVASIIFMMVCEDFSFHFSHKFLH